MKHTVITYGASTRGPMHRREGIPNQDAWLRASGRYGTLVVVCDGMGSKPNARMGARAACAAVREAASKWAHAEGAPVSYLSHLIDVFWLLRIHPSDPADAATTCLLAFASSSGRWVVGGIGDGLVVFRTGDEPVTMYMGNRENDFANETSALGVSRGGKAWRLKELPPTEHERLAVLATDGVSDDLIPEKIDLFCDWLVEDFQDVAPAKRWRLLQNELRNWPTPRHVDDKTIAVLRVTEPATG